MPVESTIWPPEMLEAVLEPVMASIAESTLPTVSVEPAPIPKV